MNTNPLLSILGEDFPSIFGDIPRPDSIAPLETAEGMCGLPECGCGESCEFCV